MLLQGTRICCVDLQLRVGSKETRVLERAEEVTVENVLGTDAGLS
jgi:hypothetical protein